MVVPVLTDALSDSDSLVRDQAIDALAEFGTNSASAVPDLITFLADTNYLVRDKAIVALGEIHSKPELTVPVLIKTFTNSEMGHFAAQGLEEFGNDATSVVPALIAMTADSDRDIRYLAVCSLGGIHSQPALTIPVLTNALNDGYGPTRAQAVMALGNFGKEAISAAPILINLYHRERNRGRKDFDPSQSIGIEILQKALLRIDAAAAAKAGISTNLSTH